MSAPAAVPPRPRVVEGAVLAAVVAGVLVAVTAGGLLVGLDASRRQVEAESGARVAESVATALFVLGVGGVLWGAAMAGLAAWFRAGRLWARPALIAVSLLVLLVLLAPTTAGITAVVLTGLADFMLLRPESRAWVDLVRQRRSDPRP